VHCCAPKQFAIVSEKDAVFGTAEAVGLVQYRIEDGFKLTGRDVDNLQDLGSCGLLGVSLITLARPLSQLLLRFVPFGLALGKPTFEIGYTLLKIG
jgi:hypothetical protein